MPILRIGPLSLPAPELAIILSVYAGLWLMETWLKRQGHNPDAQSNLVLFSLIAFLIGGRVGYIGLHWSAFAGNPADMLSLNRDLFDPLFGAAAGLLFALVLAQRKRMEPALTLTALSLFASAVLFGADLAAYASGSAYGSASDLPWAVELYGMRRHPAQVYQLFLDMIGIGSWLIFLSRARLTKKPALLLVFIALGTRFLNAAFVAEGTILPGGWRANQAALLLGMLFIAWLLLQPGLSATNPNPQTTTGTSEE